MDGYLSKWTGYIYGYQKFYFVLDHSNLFCYSSKDAYNKADKSAETITIPMCEIIRNSTEKLQFEIHKSDGTWVYYRTEKETERQQWLKALGTAKACMLDTAGFDYLTTRHYSSDTEIKSDEQSLTAPSSEESDICIIENEAIENIPTVQDESFQEVEDESVASSVVEKAPVHSNNNHDSSLACSQLKHQISNLESVLQSEKQSDDIKRNLTELKKVFDQLETSITQSTCNDELSQSESCAESVDNVVVKSGLTFMSSMKTNYVDIVHNAMAREDEEALENGIETGLFVSTCEEFLQFYDRFGGTLFQPLKADVAGNVIKVKNAFQTNPDGFFLMKTMYTDEKLLSKKTEDKGPFVGLLWLLRGLSTMANFLKLLCDKESEFYHKTPGALDAAYQATIMQYHNWALKRMFRMGMKMCPNFDLFIIAISEDGMKNLDQDKVIETVDTEILEFANAMLKVIKSLQRILPS